MRLRVLAWVLLRHDLAIATPQFEGRTYSVPFRFAGDVVEVRG